jgi:hypothetical protein
MAAFYLRSFPMVASIPPDHDSVGKFPNRPDRLLGGAPGEVIVDPDFAEHLVNELLWKSLATKVFPDTLVDPVSIMLPSSANECARAGISADLMKEENYRVTLTGSCAIRGEFECSATVGVSGNL